MEVSLAYFVYDLLCCLFIELDAVSLAHHVCTIAGLAVGVFQGKARCLLPPWRALPRLMRAVALTLALPCSAALSWWGACC
jgi:hypothetical protein